MAKSKLTIFILTCLFVFSLLGCSKENTDQDKHINPVSKTDAMMEITNAYVTEYLGLTDAAVTLGNQLSAYRLSDGKLQTIDYEIYPVFAEEKIVAFTTCFQSDTGEYLPGCGVTYAEAFWQAYSEQPGTAIALVYAQEGAYLVREGEVPVLLHKMPIEGCDSIQELEKCRSSLVYTVI